MINHSAVEEGPALVAARAKPWDWALRRRRPDFLGRMVDAAGFAPAFSCLRGRRLPARLHARLVHEAGFDPAPPGSEPGALPVAPLVSLEEGVRFGLTSPRGDPVFETGALGRSATLPWWGPPPACPPKGQGREGGSPLASHAHWRGRRDSHPQPSGRQPAAPLSSSVRIWSAREGSNLRLQLRRLP